MSDEAYQFSGRAARRIARAVRKIEGGGSGPPGGKRGSGRRPVYKKLWYKIKEYDPDTEEYTLRKLAWDDEAGELAEVADTDDPEYDLDVIGFDCSGRTDGRPADIVPGWKVHSNGEWVTLIAVPEIKRWVKAFPPSARSDDCAVIYCPAGGPPNYDPEVMSHFYGWPCLEDGTLIGTPPETLDSTTADQYCQVWLPGIGGNVRAGDIVPCRQQGGKYWIDGDGFYDRPIDSLDFKDDSTADWRGWYYCDGRSGGSAPRRQSTSVDDAGVAYNLPDYRQVYLATSGTNATHPSPSAAGWEILPRPHDPGTIADSAEGMMEMYDELEDGSDKETLYLAPRKRVN